MKTFSVVLFLALSGPVTWTSGAPRSIETLVRYNGDQLWKVEQTVLAKVTLDELEQSFGKFYYW